MHEEIWIIGFGRFGKHAALMLQKSGKRLVAVDPDPKAFSSFSGDVIAVRDDGTSFLTQGLEQGRIPHAIIAALPVHLAFEWIKRSVASKVVEVELPDELVKRLPNAFIASPGLGYASHADFICPDTCQEPDQICTVTKRKREKNMYDLIREAGASYDPVVLESRQMAPGVGGYSPESLIEARKRVLERKGDVVLATSCRCHAVISSFLIC